MLPEDKVHKILGGRQGAEAGPVPNVVQQGGQRGAGAAGSPSARHLLQQLRQVHAGLGVQLGFRHPPKCGLPGPQLAQGP